MKIRIYNEPVLFIDFSYYILHKYFAIHTWCKLAQKTLNDDEMIERFENKFEETLLKIAKKYCIRPDNILFIGDSSRNTIWRKDIYPEYKSTRDLQPMNVPTKFFEAVYTRIIPYITQKFNNQYISIERLEADDIIAVLTRYSLDRNLTNITIITNDNDYQQLNHEYVNIFNLKHIDICKRGTGDPIKDLRLKILLGDKSDNIKPICTKKIANGLVDMNECDLCEYLEIKKLHASYELNASLIDFNHIPKHFLDDLHQSVEVLTRENTT
jgi:5'-3' exonuclease